MHEGFVFRQRLREKVQCTNTRAKGIPRYVHRPDDLRMDKGLREGNRALSSDMIPTQMKFFEATVVIREDVGQGLSTCRSDTASIHVQSFEKTLTRRKLLHEGLGNVDDTTVHNFLR